MNDALEKAVINALRGIIEPLSKQDIVSLHLVKSCGMDEDGIVHVEVELPEKSKDHSATMKLLIEASLKPIEGVKGVQVSIDVASASDHNHNTQQDGLKQIKHIIAVSSCKGGVGKSTVAVNLAFTLKKQGLSVGIFDADVYGPSLPTMVDVTNPVPIITDTAVMPIEAHGLTLMSFGFVQKQLEKEGAAIMRGPMVSQVITQLLLGTQWGELDVLIIDFPPGTGDIQLTLGQIAPITAALIVTQPQDLSFIDVVKGIEMFDTLKIPTVGVVENMSYFMCGSCDTKHRIFGAGAKRRLSSMFGIEQCYEIPLDPEVAPSGDDGQPLVITHENHLITKIFEQIATDLRAACQKIEDAPESGYHFHVDDEGLHILFDEVEKGVTGLRALRSKCRCAKCEDEFTGKRLLDEASIPETIQVGSIGTVGNYALAIDWSDGHHSMFPYTQIERILAE